MHVALGRRLFDDAVGAFDGGAAVRQPGHFRGHAEALGEGVGEGVADWRWTSYVREEVGLHEARDAERWGAEDYEEGRGGADEEVLLGVCDVDGVR